MCFRAGALFKPYPPPVDTLLNPPSTHKEQEDGKWGPKTQSSYKNSINLIITWCIFLITIVFFYFNRNFTLDFEKKKNTGIL